MKDLIIEKLRDMEFKGISLPSVKEGNLPSAFAHLADVRIPKNKYAQFRDWYLFMQVFISAVLNKADFTQYELEELLGGMVMGNITIKIEHKTTRGIGYDRQR